MFKKIHAYIVINEDNRYYFTGFNSSFGCVILTENKKYFITDSRYEGAARKFVEDAEVVLLGADGLYVAIAAIIKKTGAKVLGYEDQSLTVAEFGQLKEALKGFQFKPVSDILNAKRAVKTEAEIARIAEAQAVTQKALAKTIASLKSGMTEKDVSDILTCQMLNFGSDGPAFSNIVAFGANAGVPHHKPNGRKLDKNDIILIDCGARVNGYCGDITRTFCFGNPGEKLASIHRIVKEAQEYALNRIKAGITCHEVDALAREYIIANGYGDEFGHSLGHGIGIAVHEAPRVGRNSMTVLEENMVISVEPGIYVDGLGGVRIEDLVAVKADGIVNLTNFNKNLDI